MMYSKCLRCFAVLLFATLHLPGSAAGPQLHSDGPIPASAIKPAHPGQFPTGFYLPPSMRHMKPGSLKIQPKAEIATAPSDPAFDWTALSACTPVRDQGSTNTCWVFASLGEFEPKMVLYDGASNTTLDYSEQDITNYFPDGPNTGGNQFMSYSFLAQHGVVEESAESWLNSIIPQPWDSANPKLRQVTSMVYLGDLTAPTAQNILAIKNALTYGPVYTSLSIDAIRAWAASQGHPGDDMWWGTQVVPGTVSATISDHAVAIVGWDDNKLQAGGLASGAWKIRNSWSSAWGTGGYGWIGYGAAACGEATSYTPPTGFSPYDADVKVVGNDFAWGQSWGGVGLTSVHMLAKLTMPVFATSTNELTAIDLALLNPNTSYQIDLYSSFDGTDVSGFLGSKSGSQVNAGYYSIPLNSAIPVSSEQTIAIKVRLSTPAGTDYQFAAPLETWSPHSDNMYYYSFDGTSGSWTDSHDDAYAFSNEFIIRARVFSDSATAVRGWETY